VPDVPVLAIHVDHALQTDSANWSKHCAQIAAELEIDFRSLLVDVQLESGKGPEASARDARYAALSAELSNDDWLLSAHHREDQAETLLLNLIRGSGPAGVAGIGDVRRIGPGWLVRPMLNVDRADIELYANDMGLHWIEDPSNEDQRFDRNFLRHEVLPRLKSRWPDIAARLQRSAGHAGEASQLLIELAAIDLESLGSRAARLPIDGLSGLSVARQRNVIRFALRELGLSTPTAVQLVSWAGASVRRYRNGLYLLPENLADAVASESLSGADLELGIGLGTLHFKLGADIGISEELFSGGLTIKPRTGGEEIQLQGQPHTSKLKKLLQEEGIVPWMRDRLPLVYSGDRRCGLDTGHRSALEWSSRIALMRVP